MATKKITSTKERRATIRFLVSLTPELHSRLHTAAQNDRRTMTNLVALLIEDGLKTREGVMR